MIIIIILVFCVNYSLTEEYDSCFINQEIHHHWLGTKTPYRFVSNGRIEEPTIPNCEAAQIWMFSRHATRYPQDADIKILKKLPKTRDKIVKSHDKGKGCLCERDVEKLKQWVLLPNASLSTPDIATEGWREGHELGKIYKNAFPKLLAPASNEINSEDYVFNAKRGKRAEYSMYAFMEGLFGSKTLVEPAPYLKPNYILQPEKNCPLWSHSNTNSGNSERDKFMDSPEYTEMSMNVSQRLGFDVSLDEIRRMQDMCRYETAWIRNYTSPWCDIFTEEEWKILEYLDDIRYYYNAADYEVKTNGLLSCFAVQDMLDNFRKIEDGNTNGKPKGIFYFSNARHLLGLLSALGIGNDTEILRADNYEQLANRKWRTSFLSPFFSNFVATFYRCNVANSSNKVTFHLDEKLVMIEGCENGICDWNFLRTKFLKPPGQCISDCIYKKKTRGNCQWGICDNHTEGWNSVILNKSV